MSPAIEELIVRTESKFILVTLAAKRSREITDYLGQRNVGIGAVAPPQVATEAAKPLTIALEEIAAGKIQAVQPDQEQDEEQEPESESASDPGRMPESESASDPGRMPESERPLGSRSA